MDLASPHVPVTPLASAQHFLARVEVLIDWTLLETATGRDALEEAVPVHALKIALLKLWYGLADQEAPFQILDRLSLRAFAGYSGDGGATDARIVEELEGCAWARHPAMAEAIDAVESQLKALGYAVRCGRVQEPSLSPCTESGSDVRIDPSGPTALFRPGELGRMMEAVTAKAHADGVVPAPQAVAPAGSQDEATVLAVPGEASQAAAQGAVRAVIEWPWGQRTELTEHLNIGRDFQFSPLARELTPYTHVSRKHAELLVYGDGVWIRDLGSRNGTFVNDEEVPKGQAYLIDADAVIRFGPLLAAGLKLSV